MQKNKTKMTPEYKAELWVAFSWVAMIKVAFDWFFPQHASLAIFLADSICVILFGIIAIVYANKANPPAKKWKNWGIANIVIGLILPFFLIIVFGVIPKMAQRNSAATTSAKPQSTEKAEINASTAEPTDIPDIEYSATPEADTVTGLTYEDVYDDYIVKIDQASDDAIDEYKEKSVGMSDEDKSDLASSLTEKVNDVAYEGSGKIFDISMQTDDTSDEYSQWQDKLTDHADERTEELNELVYGE